jgi:pilus assembly protein CpaE
MAPRASERGQATVELVALLPAVLLVGLLVWQVALAGHAAWATANAARVAARAVAVDRDAERAARSALPKGLERGLRVRRNDDGLVEVGVRVPLVVRAWGSIATVRARARLKAAP